MKKKIDKCGVEDFRWIMFKLVCVCAIAIIVGCSDSNEKGDITSSSSTAPEAQCSSPSSLEIIKENLAKAGLCAGFDAKRNVVIEIGSYSRPISDKPSETDRQFCFQKAFDSALGEIALCIGSYIENDSVIVDGTNVAKVSQSYYKRLGGHKNNDEVMVSCTQLAEHPVFGTSIISVAESVNNEDNNWIYEISMAVVWSPKLRDSMCCIFDGDETAIPNKPGKYSIEQWVDKQQISLLIGGRSIVDSQGDRWLIGTITDDGNIEDFLIRKLKEGSRELCMGPFVNELRLFGERLTGEQLDYLKKAYALWTASKLVGVNVKVCREMSKDEVKEDLDVRILNGILQENDRILWFERKEKSRK